ncbi:transmembrane protein 192-like [Argopecten irradians]|uniref:transmembrane protein 192-like n=1 Tax=Argopecten irradians TaxID=31199 RepID=UPI003717EDBA
MVSLSNENRRSGGYFFNDDNNIQGRDGDEPLLDSPTYTTELDRPFRVINTTAAIALQILILVISGAVVLALDSIYHNRAEAIIYYIQGALWFLHLTFDMFYRHCHKKSRLHGYLEFYRQTRLVRQLPLAINSAVNAGLIILNSVARREGWTPDTGEHNKVWHLSLRLIVVIHIVIKVIVLILYLVKTVKFNKSHVSPDVAQDDMMASFVQSTHSSEIGFRDEQYTEQVLEKQADMIRYLKQHNAQLGKRILALTAENQNLKSGNS